MATQTKTKSRLKTVVITVVIVIALPMILVFVPILYGLSPLGYISQKTGFYPILSWPLTYSDYDPQSFREVDTLYAFKLSHIDRRRVESFFQDKPEWQPLPLSKEAGEAEQIVTKSDDPYVQKVLKAIHGFWYWDKYRQLYVYDSDLGEIYFLYSTKVAKPETEVQPAEPIFLFAD